MVLEPPFNSTSPRSATTTTLPLTLFYQCVRWRFGIFSLLCCFHFTRIQLASNIQITIRALKGDFDHPIPEHIRRRDNLKEEVVVANEQQYHQELQESPPQAVISSSDTLTNTVVEDTPKAKLQDAKENTAVNVQAKERTNLNSNADDDISKAKQVHFIKLSQLDSDNDSFAAAWLQNRANFMSMNLDNVNIAIDAVFRAYHKKRKKVKLTLDWMDWSVEHTSKWWKIFYQKNSRKAHKTMMRLFQNYLKEARPRYSNPPSTLQETIAVMPFFDYPNPKHPERGQEHSILILAATVESFRRAGFGRVVVSVMEATNTTDQEQLAQQHRDIRTTHMAFRYLQRQLASKGEAVPPTILTNETEDMTVTQTMIGHMEVAIAVASREDAKSRLWENNFPKACLVGLRKAFDYSTMTTTQSSSSANLTTQQQQQHHVQSWLGSDRDPSYWKYVYYSEPDQMLQTRGSAALGIKTELDGPGGAVVVPHRLQPIPHQSDLPGMENARDHFLFASEFPNITQVERERVACCDEILLGPNRTARPSKEIKSCVFWWQCGFGKPQDPHRHDVLKQYPLLRITPGGTGIVTIAGSEHGRRCTLLPQGGSCQWKSSVDAPSVLAS